MTGPGHPRGSSSCSRRDAVARRVRLNGVVLQSPADLKAVIEAERAGTPFVVYRDGEDVQRLLILDPARERVTVGRSLANGLCLEWDTEVSRLHAEVERVGGDWTLADDGLSRNGTFVNGEPGAGPRRPPRRRRPP